MFPRMCFLITRISASRVLFIIILLYAASLMYTYNARLYAIRAQRKNIPYLNHKSLKYILLWTRRFSEVFDRMGEGNSAFVRGKCEYTNCFVTDDKNYFINQTDFDAIAFGVRDVIRLWPFQMPAARTPTQKYIFAASESSEYFPTCDKILDGFFNWTWTYRLESDLYWGYIVISDMAGNVVGPAIDMKWPDKLDPINEELKIKLSKKSRAVAWFVSHCSTKSGRERYVAELQEELKVYGLGVDIYGACGTLSCPRSDETFCFDKVQSDYYFYLSFENSFSDDYVTEKLLTALNNFAVPVVYGGANYSRYLPPGSYLNARELNPERLARRIDDIINDASSYYDFFRWRNHYKYKETDPSEEVCKLCRMMNDEGKVAQVTEWHNFRAWWNDDRFKDNC